MTSQQHRLFCLKSNLSTLLALLFLSLCLTSNAFGVPTHESTKSALQNTKKINKKRKIKLTKHSGLPKTKPKLAKNTQLDTHKKTNSAINNKATQNPQQKKQATHTRKKVAPSAKKTLTQNTHRKVAQTKASRHTLKKTVQVKTHKTPVRTTKQQALRATHKKSPQGIAKENTRKTYQLAAFKSPDTQYGKLSAPRKGQNNLASLSNIDKVLNTGKSYIGTPYRLGGTTLHGIDCSALVQRIYADSIGLKLPRTSREMAHIGIVTPKNELRPGDLVFFNTRRGRSKTVTHVGIYVGHGKFLHAPSRGKHVRIDNLSSDYWTRNFVTARHILNSHMFASKTASKETL